MTENAPSFVDLMIQWLANNPGWSGLAVFLISLGESLAVVGLFIPGTLVMFGIGALVAMGGMDLWDTLLWATLGAIVGDGISFWIGHHYRESMRTMWPFKKHPEWLTRAEVFFARHGGKSVIFGRFVGPVRPIIPVVAGMMGMSPSRFYLANVVSALLWAPSYILPGVVLGASLSLAAGVTTRLAILVVLVVGVLWITTWLVGRIYRQLQPHAYQFMTQFLKNAFQINQIFIF
jgi:membrane protein DedA with SNARE-associated domain